MADIHAASFDTGWDALEMSVHCTKDLCLGLGEPLSAFIICSVAADQAEILTLATRPEARRSGLGRMLLVETVTALRDKQVTELFLEVAEDNLAARELYKGAGFSAIGRRPGYYRRPQGRMAAITFSKKL